MKLVIEIDDAALKAAIEQQVGKAIAALAEEVITQRAESILSKKLERFDPYSVAEGLTSEEVKSQVARAVNDALGSAYGRNSAIRDLIKEAALNLVRSTLK